MANENRPYDNRIDLASIGCKSNDVAQSNDIAAREAQMRQQQMRYQQQIRNQSCRQSFRNARQYPLRR